MRRWSLLFALFSFPVAAQTVSISAPSLFIAPNEGRNPAGQIEGTEAGAFTARAEGVGAVFYNPAGLAHSMKSSVSAASAAYEWTFYSGEVGDIADTGSRLSTNGRLFGFVVGGEVLGSEKLSLGFAIPTPVSWKPTLQLSGVIGTGYSGAGMIYSTDGSYADVVPTIAAGYALRPNLRLGGSLGLSFLTLSNNQTSSVQGMASGGAGLAQRTFRADGTSYDILLTAGLQWDLSRAVTLGFVAAAPGLHTGGSTSLIVEETTATAGGYRTAWFRDPEAEFTVKHQTRLSLGLSWRFARGEVEADVKYYAGTSKYEMFSSASARSVDGSLARLHPDGGGGLRSRVRRAQGRDERGDRRSLGPHEEDLPPPRLLHVAVAGRRRIGLRGGRPDRNLDGRHAELGAPLGFHRSGLRMG